MGVPLQQPGQDWTFDPIEKTDSLTYAPVDEITRQTLVEIQQIWIQAHKNQDYEKLTNIGRDIQTLLNSGNEILRLQRVLQDCIRTEDFEKAIDVRNEIKKHEMKRESFDMIYETSKFGDDLELGAPSEKFLAEQKELELEELRRQDGVRQRKERDLEREREKREAKERELREEQMRRE